MPLRRAPQIFVRVERSPAGKKTLRIRNDGEVLAQHVCVAFDDGYGTVVLASSIPTGIHPGEAIDVPAPRHRFALKAIVDWQSDVGDHRYVGVVAP